MSRPLVLLLTRTGDPAIAALAGCASAELAVATPRDLSRPGWHFGSGASARMMARVGDRVLDARECSLILCRLGRIMPSDLEHIALHDRRYCADEMTAFLLAWLDRFDGIVANPARPGTLGGSPWTTHEWQRAAIDAGACGAVARDPAGPVHAIPFVLGEALGAHPAALRRVGAQLARRAQLPCVELRFAAAPDGWRFVSADPYPAPHRAMLDALLARRGGPDRTDAWT